MRLTKCVPRVSRTLSHPSSCSFSVLLKSIPFIKNPTQSRSLKSPNLSNSKSFCSICHNLFFGGSQKRVWRNYPEDFAKEDTKPKHLDMHFDITEQRVIVEMNATYVYKGQGPLTILSLNSDDLEIRSVQRYSRFSKLGDTKDFAGHVKSLGEPKDEKYDVDKENHFLRITFTTPVQPGEEFVLRTVTVATPTANILEGIYYDYTPAGKPRTMITQCQQYGFQRIVPCVDTMTAKTFYTTTITSNAQYSNIITNGDLAPGYFDQVTGLPTPQKAPAVSGVDFDRVTVVYHNHKVCMAPYLFFLGVGTYVTYRRQVEYADGDTFTIELLVFPNLVKSEHARVAISAMHDSIQWVYNSTGPETYDHLAERKEIWALIKEREELKSLQAPLVTASDEPRVALKALSADQAQRLAAIRERLKTLIKAWKNTGYKYTGMVYREIAMENSDYGGMENVGNTTILSSRLVPSDQQTDRGYIYMEGVKVHEFYHNINGSQVTGQSPFEIWLNEAVTVHIERAREDDLFGADFMQLKQVIYSFYPAVGPLALDSAPNSMAIEPEGFNRTQELISAMTYSKAPEFVRMVELLITKPVFVRGLHNYHTKYSFSNATTLDWIRCMEEVSGQQLQSMAKGWLKRTGHPKVSYTTKYDADKKTYTASITQTGFEEKPEAERYPWDFPIDWALIKNGQTVASGVYRMTKAAEELVIPNVNEAPDFLSFARNWSFFGTVTNKSATPETLASQALSDNDVINRYFAYRTIADQEKANVIKNLVEQKGDYQINEGYVKLNARILFDETITPSTRALILQELEEISRYPELSHLYREIADARTALLQSVWDQHAAAILKYYNELQAANKPGPHKDGLHHRALKHYLFEIIVAGLKKPVLSTRKPSDVKANVPAMARALLFESTFATDKLFGFRHYLQSDAGDREAVRDEVRKQWKSHPDSVESYIEVLSGLDSDVAPKYIRDLMNDKDLFNINLAGHARTVCRGWSGLRKRSLLTEEGLQLSVDLLIQVGKVNQMSANAILNAFNDLPKFKPEQRKTLITALNAMKAGIDAVAQQSLYKQITTILEKSA